MDKHIAKQEILKATLHSIYLDGIRATKVDDIAASLSISKRTLYELYPSKTDLMLACLGEMEKEWNKRADRNAADATSDAFTRTWEFISYYIENLYKARIPFWTDLIRDEQLSRWCSANRQEWIRRFSALSLHCQQEGYFLQELDAAALSDCLLTGIFQSRIDNRPPAKQYLYGYVMMRGASTPAGICYLDKIIAQSDGKQKESLLLCK